MKSLADCRLYTFVDTAYLHGRDPVETTRALCDGGSDLIQLRAKGEPLEVVLQMARRLLPITRAAGVRLVINDYFALAQNVGADVCHLGQEDFFDAGYTRVETLRKSTGHPEIGLSTHSPEQALRAMAAGADYLAVGPVWATGTKPTASPVTLDYVRWASTQIDRPWFAIGGINLDRLDAVVEAGATRICVVSAILQSADIAASCREFLRRLG